MRPTLDRITIGGLWTLLIVGVYWLSLFPLSSYDVWLHLGIGQEIVQRGEIPRTAWGSRLYPDQKWMAHEWAFQAAYFKVYSRWGPEGLVRLRAIAACIAAAALLWALTEAGAGPYAACAAASLAAFVGFTQLFWPARPQIVTQALLPILLALLYRGRAGRRRLLPVVPLLFVFWVNLHGGFIIGLVLIVLFLAAELLQPLFGRQPDRGWVRTLALVLLISTAGCLANPYTFRSLFYPLSYYFGDPITAGNIEWAPIVLHRFPLYEALVLLTAFSVLHTRRTQLLEIVLALAFFHLAVISVRHVPLAATVLGCALGTSWSRRWSDEGLGSGPLGRAAAAIRASPWRQATLTLLFMALTWGSTWLSEMPPMGLNSGPLSPRTPLPVDAVRYLKEEGLTEGLFNQYEWGGYLLFQFPGEAIVSIDGRNDIYGAEHNRRYQEAMEGIPTWKETFSDWGVKVVLISRGPQGWGLRFVLHSDPEWDLKFEGPNALVFVRR